eukprot:COSAG06_NODE_1768_length_8432_cov_5.547822_5_plen_71_part_00
MVAVDSPTLSRSLSPTLSLRGGGRLTGLELYDTELHRSPSYEPASMLDFQARGNIEERVYLDTSAPVLAS